MKTRPPHPIMVDGVQYNTMTIAADVIGTSSSNIRYALDRGGLCRGHIVSEVQPQLRGQRKSEMLMPVLVTHRLGAYIGGWW